MSKPDSDFAQTWGYARDVMASIPGAAAFEINPLPTPFKSGRARFEAVFVNAGRTKVVAKRDAMQLVAKRSGQPYFMVRRSDDWSSPAAQPNRANVGFDLDDVIIR